MASNITKAPIFRTISARRFSNRAECAPIGGVPDYKINTTTLPNKLFVASAENEAIISRVSIAFRGGSRYESVDNIGAAHVIRICAGLSSRRATQFAITRNIQQAGCVLTCSNDRETIAYTLEGTRSAVEKTLPFLTEVATQQCFKPWELSDNIPRLRLELATRTKQLRVIDLLHKAAYRGHGLGNSIYIPKYKLESFSSETLQHYVAKHFTADRAAVVGLGIDQQYLINYAQSLQFENSSSQTDEPSEYKGGEIRSDKDGKLAYVAIAGQGGRLENAKEALSFAILQRCFGAGTSIKYANENKGLFSKAAGSSAVASSVRALNISYSDSGLFGALITSPGVDAGHMVKTVHKILKSGMVSDEDFRRGKNQFKTAVLLALESGSTAIEDMGIQALLTHSVANATEIVCAIDAIKLSDVNDAAKKLAASKLSIASVGNIKGVPFLDELK